MSNDQWIAARIRELTSEEYAQLIRICEIRRERDRIANGGDDVPIGEAGTGAPVYETGVPDEIARVLDEKDLVHRGVLSTTAATNPTYSYYRRIIVGN